MAAADGCPVAIVAPRRLRKRNAPQAALPPVLVGCSVHATAPHRRRLLSHFGRFPCSVKRPRGGACRISFSHGLKLRYLRRLAIPAAKAIALANSIHRFYAISAPGRHRARKARLETLRLAVHIAAPRERWLLRHALDQVRRSPSASLERGGRTRVRGTWQPSRTPSSSCKGRELLRFSLLGPRR